MSAVRPLTPGSSSPCSAPSSAAPSSQSRKKASPSLAKISVSQLLELALQTAIVFGAVLIGCYLFLYILPLWKFVGSRNKSMGIAMSQLLGFPATYLIVNEVATAVAETPDEKAYIVKELTPAFVVSGFVSVTSISIIIAGIFAKFI